MNRLRMQLRRRPKDVAACGYTLLEMLIVFVLLSVLMVGVWSMLRNWSRLYERGQRLTRQAQLVRSLCDQLEDDLHAVSFRPPPDRPGGSGLRSRGRRTSSGAVALVGEKDWMVLDVLQSVNPYAEPPDDSSEEPADPETSGTASAPECQRVIYQFRGRSDDLSSAIPMADMEPAEDAVAPFYGLIRIAVARESIDQLLALGSSSGDGSGRRTAVKEAVQQICDMVLPSEQSDVPSIPTEEDPVTSDDPAQMGRPSWLPGIVQQDEMPEIGWLEFRYFDGRTWQDSWDSRAQGRVPVAVEIRFEVIDLPVEPEVASDSELLDGSGEESLTADQAADKALLDGEEPLWSGEGPSFDTTGAADDQPPPYHRCIIYLEPPKKWRAVDEMQEDADENDVMTDDGQSDE